MQGMQRGGAVLVMLAVIFAAGCGDPAQKPPSDAEVMSDGDAPDGGSMLQPGDLCTAPAPAQVRAHFSPQRVFLPPCTGDITLCASREVTLVLEPDVCAEIPYTLTSSSPALQPPDGGSFGLYDAAKTLTVHGAAAAGSYQITASVPRGDGTNATATLEVEVVAPAADACSGSNQTDALAQNQILLGQGGLAGASIRVPDHANAPNQGSYLWSVPPFPAALSCGSMNVPAGAIALGPAITFGPDQNRKFPRDLPLSVPVNPALMPAAARLRHVQVLYSSPAFKTPRIVPVADVAFERVGGAWAMTFKAPRLGTYQAIVPGDAGTHTDSRRLTHRAVIGVSTGGMGASMFGVRHHDLFDVVAPLGGPAAFTWLMNTLAHDQLGGFPAIPNGTTLAQIQLTKTTCTTSDDCASGETCVGKTATTSGRCTLMPTPSDPYAHPSTFNNLWAEVPNAGNPGPFTRSQYAELFADLAVMFGNPNGDNLTAGGEALPAGVPPTDKSVVGDHAADTCALWVEPLGGADNANETSIANSCPLERCAHTLTLQNYFDREYNPDGIFPVITVCDGAAPDAAQSPWSDAWSSSSQYPLEVALAVDYNGNGVRDELEPIITAGHEPFDDTGPDGKLDVDEPGYVAGVNDDPNGDDYDAQFNPGGTENDHRWQPGEPFQDVGLDGVPSTPQQPAYPVGWRHPGDGYDVGEGDGMFTATRGLKRFWDHDPGNMVRGSSTDIPGGPLDDAALRRLDVWTDGGLRDPFNFHVAAQHMIGSWAARHRATTYYTGFSQLPGAPDAVAWQDVPSGVLLRYGEVDPSQQAIDEGSGQHLGSPAELTNRLHTALYYIGSRWRDSALRSRVEDASVDPDPTAAPCEVAGTCTFDFTSSSGRTGPATVLFPPGYAHHLQQSRRYPVIYMLHGYNQSAAELATAVASVGTWMNDANASVATRLPKAIVVFVDGRCRKGPDGKPECFRGGFYADSSRAGGFQNESWMLELMSYVDSHYRTMAATTEDWTE